jgi:hypothetical protein
MSTVVSPVNSGEVLERPKSLMVSLPVCGCAGGVLESLR